MTEPVLDLGAGEVAARLAWIDHVLGEQLDARVPGVRRRIRHEARTRVLDPFVARDDWGWLQLAAEQLDPWIHAQRADRRPRAAGGAGARRGRGAGVAEGLGDYLASLPADGAIDEGYSYWWQGACRALEALDPAGARDAASRRRRRGPVVRAMVDYPHTMHLGGDWYLGVGDGTATPPADLPWHVLHSWALRTGSAAAAGTPPRSTRTPPCPSVAASAARWRRWPTPGGRRPTPPSPLPAHVWFRRAPRWACCARPPGRRGGWPSRSRAGTTPSRTTTTTSARSSSRSTACPWSSTPAAPPTPRRRSAPHRYEIWTMQSSWHSVPEVRGTPQCDGREFRATQASTDGDRLQLDLTAAYPTEDLTRWTRTVTLDRAGVARARGGRLGGEPGRDRNGRALDARRVRGGHRTGLVTIHPLDGARPTRLTWDPATVTSSLTVRPLDDPMLSDVWGDHLTRLELAVDDSAGHGSLAVTVEVAR